MIENHYISELPRIVSTYQIRCNLEELAKDVTCDICGQSCVIGDFEGGHVSAEYATLFAHWGFFSRRDCKENQCDMCEQCFQKVVDFIQNDLKGVVREEDWSTKFRRPRPRHITEKDFDDLPEQ